MIVANSELTRSQLIKAGFPEDRIQIGPSLRFSHLFEDTSVSGPEARSILVALAFDADASRELLKMLVSAFREDDDVRFYIKAHPAVTDLMFEKLIAGLCLPPFMQRVCGSMGEWIPRATCAVSGATTAAFELAVAGVPLVLVGREADLDINPLADCPEIDPPDYTVNELRHQVMSLVDSDRSTLGRFKEWKDRMRRTALNPVTADTMKVFQS